MKNGAKKEEAKQCVQFHITYISALYQIPEEVSHKINQRQLLNNERFSKLTV
jgi:hypothetical protein